MPYRRRYSTTRRRSTNRGGFSAPRRRSTRARSASRRRSTARSAQTLRIVIEQPGQQLARDMLNAGVVPASRGPRKASF